MAVSTTIAVNDNVTTVIQHMVSTVNLMIAAYSDLQGNMDEGLNTSTIEAAREEMTQAGAAAQFLGNDSGAAGSSIRDLSDEERNAENSTKQFKEAMEKLAAALAIKKVISDSINATKDFIGSMNTQLEAEIKLQTVMRQRMDATNAQVKSIKDLASAQQKIGVIGDEVQLAGAQQLATFLNTSTALKELIPAMNNLAVQQNGVNVSAGDMVSIGNMMGKVMQGSTSALTRVGITFTEAQEKALKYGNEEERAATLAQVITDNVGEMNSVLAQTPEGKAAQMANDFGDLKEIVGAEITPAMISFYDALNNAMPVAEAGMNAFAIVATVVLDVLTGIVNGIEWVYEAAEPIIVGLAPAIAAIAATLVFGAAVWGVYSLATSVATTVTAIFASAQWAAVAPIILSFLYISLIIAALYAVVGAYNKSAGASISATGIIVGGVRGVLAVIQNGVIFMYNIIANVANFLANVFNNPIASVEIAFLDMATTVLGYIRSIASGIETLLNAIPGVNVSITGFLDNIMDLAKTKSSEIKTESDWKEVVQNKDFIDVGDAVVSGYNWGAGLAGKISSFSIGDFVEGIGTEGAGALSNIADNTGKTADNTGKSADSLDVSKEQLQYLRDIAERDVINRFTTDNFKFEFTNNNNARNIDGVVDKFADELREYLNGGGEGAPAVV